MYPGTSRPANRVCGSAGNLKIISVYCGTSRPCESSAPIRVLVHVLACKLLEVLQPIFEDLLEDMNPLILGGFESLIGGILSLNSRESYRPLHFHRRTDWGISSPAFCKDLCTITFRGLIGGCALLILGGRVPPSPFEDLLRGSVLPISRKCAPKFIEVVFRLYNRRSCAP